MAGTFKSPLSTFTVVHNPAAATQATISRATPAAQAFPASPGYQPYAVVTSIVASIAAGATASGVVHAHLRDGATGAGTIKLSAALSAPVNGSSIVALSGLTIPITSGTATLEFDAGGAATSVESVAMCGFDVGYGDV